MHAGFGVLVGLGVTLAAAFAGDALAQPSAPGVSPTTVVLGQSAPLSGANKELGTDIRNGALALFAKVNAAGGVSGRKIELVTLDDANVVKTAGENTRKLLEDEKVFALFGYASATLSRPALPQVEKHRAPFLAPFTGADPMRTFNRYVYNFRASYADELEKIVDHYSLFGIKRFAIVHYDDVVGNENLAAVDRALKKRNLSAVSVAAFKDRAKPDIESGVKSVLQGLPEVVILTTLYKASADFIKLAKGAGSTAQCRASIRPSRRKVELPFPARRLCAPSNGTRRRRVLCPARHAPANGRRH